MTTLPPTRDIAAVRVWDLPTRLFHWTLVTLITVMAVTGWTGSLDLHMLLGQAVLALVLFRLVWGFTGNRYARFGSFVRSEEHTSELQSLMRISYAVFCMEKQ